MKNDFEHDVIGRLNLQEQLNKINTENYARGLWVHSEFKNEGGMIRLKCLALCFGLYFYDVLV